MFLSKTTLLAMKKMTCPLKKSQYSVFSDSPTLLPLRSVIVEDLNFEASLDISINLFQAVGGLAEFVAFCGAKTDKNEPLFSEKNKIAAAMLNQLINII